MSTLSHRHVRDDGKAIEPNVSRDETILHTLNDPEVAPVGGAGGDEKTSELLDEKSALATGPSYIAEVSNLPGMPESHRHRVRVGPTAHEVHAVVPSTDDPNEMCETLRAYVIGTILSVLGTALNTWFGARRPGIYLSPYLAQFVAQPIGLLWARIMPTHSFPVPFGKGRRWTLNTGAWTVKEHTIVTLMCTVALPTATSLEVIFAIKNRNFFNDPELGDNKGFQMLLTLSTQFLGFGIAGMAREYLVYPSNMLWPTNLAKVALFNALHNRKVDEHGEVVVQERRKGEKDPPVHGWTVSMFRFCLYCAAGSFAWLFLTSMIAPFLTYFNWPTWIAPNNAKLAIIMGTISGFGLNPIPTFDWTYMSGAGLTPLITPWWATLTTFVGATLGFFVCVGMYFSNTWFAAYLPPNSNIAFDRFGLSYNTTAVLNPDHTFNYAAYLQYSPLYYSTGYNVVLGAYFAAYTATLTYALLNHWTQLKSGFLTGIRNAKELFGQYTHRPDVNGGETEEIREDLDIHWLIMRKYKEVPQYWFIAVSLGALVLGIIDAEVHKTTMPVWGLFFCFAMSAVFLIPAGIIQAISNVQIGLVILAEIIPGVLIPGRPYANMIFKMYGWISLILALLYVQDQKLAHYLHVPPRATFRAQMFGCLISSFISVAVMDWQFKAVPDLCDPLQKDLLTCPYYTTFYSSAILFGVIGPQRVYSSTGLYHNLLWAFFVGFALTVVAWALKKRWPNKVTNSLNVPVMISGVMYYAPYNWSFVWSGVPAAFAFMSYAYKRFPAWWNKYCYILSIGLTIGAAFSAVLQFFAITYPGAAFPAWWGNTFYVSGCDAIGCPLKAMPEVGYIGPAPGQYI